MSNQEENETDSAPSSNWAELTHVCLLNILSRLTLTQRWTGPMFVCRSWFSACKDPVFHSAFDLETHFESLAESPRWWTPEFERRIDSMLRSVIEWSEGSLVEIKTRHCSDRALSFAAERCPNLEVLSIKSCPNVTDNSLTRIAFRCSKLRELDISYCYEVSHQSLAIIGRNCQNLKVLKRNLMNWDASQHEGIVPKEYLNACPQDGDSEASAIARFMPNLEHLELRFSKLSARGLCLICEGCLNMECLDLSGCINFTSRDIVNTTSNLKNLKQIIKPNFYIPRSVFHTDRYGHWRLYDERFQTDIFRI
ncbi:hypothetical protein Patl1_14569 [Pistacia atlantica]|uniref:Uncharacterized protein n=2 Tax=Pistacia TaxID=55512 RepID=A0ACC1AVX1_9ROSI|nr:hypothetical protein Patl1_14569 [Pistacia atlantica]